MDIPSFESINIPHEIKERLESLIDDNFDWDSALDIDRLKDFLVDYIDPVYIDVFKENISPLEDETLKKTINEYNQCINRSSAFNKSFHVMDARQRIKLLVQWIFIKKIVSNKFDENKSENKEKIYDTLSDYPEQTEYTLIGFWDEWPDDAPTSSNTNFRNRIYEKLKLDIKKLYEDYWILEQVLWIFQWESKFLIGRHELRDGKVIITVKEENTSSGIIKSTSVDYKLAYDYNNPDKYTDFPLVAALTLGWKTNTINLRNRNAELQKRIKSYTH